VAACRVNPSSEAQERLVVSERVRLERVKAAHPLRPGGWRLARDGGGGEVDRAAVAFGAAARSSSGLAEGSALRLLSGSPGTSGSAPSSSIPSRPRRRRCRSMRRTVLSSTAPTSLACRWRGTPRPGPSRREVRRRRSSGAGDQGQGAEGEGRLIMRDRSTTLDSSSSRHPHPALLLTRSQHRLRSHRL